MGGQQRVEAVGAWESLFRAQVAVMRRLQREFPEGLTLNEYDLLFNLGGRTGDRARLRDVTERLLISQPSVSRLVDRMVERGLLVKTADPADRRGAIIEITDEGAHVYREVAVRHVEAIRHYMSGALEGADLAALKTITDRLTAQLPPARARR